MDSWRLSIFRRGSPGWARRARRLGEAKCQRLSQERNFMAKLLFVNGRYGAANADARRANLTQRRNGTGQFQALWPRLYRCICLVMARASRFETSRRFFGEILKRSAVQ